jgi:hypothetical protein
MDLQEREGISPPKAGYTGEIRFIKSMEEPNPGSPEQVKEWLFTLGWEPCYYKQTKSKATGIEKEVPQVRKNGSLTPSVEALIEKAPEVEALSNLTVIQHRIGFFQSMLDNMSDGKVKATVNGFTNTLRFKHNKPLANIPGNDSPWGKEIRECLIAPGEGKIVCGSDMSSLESRTKAHYIYPLDPEYALAMTADDFDEHLDLAVQAGEVNLEDYRWFVDSGEESGERYNRLKKTRKQYKPVNYGGIYGIGKDKLARENGFTVSKAGSLLKKYWERNWAVKELVKDLKVRVVAGKMWLLNPVSGFWYSLRYDKDRFSTLNQGTGVFCFDTWLGYARAKGVVTCGQFHDEYIGPLDEDDKEHNTEVLQWAIKKTNERLKLNIDLSVDIQYGNNYSEIH